MPDSRNGPRPHPPTSAASPAKQMAVTNVEFLAFQRMKKVVKVAVPSDSRSEPVFQRVANIITYLKHRITNAASESITPRSNG